MRMSKLLPLMKPLYSFSRAYCDRYCGENNGNILTNGELWFLKQHLPKCLVVFDVGANKGMWSKLAIDNKPSIELHCFEPIKKMYDKLLINAFPPNAHCNNFGLSSKKGTLDIYIDIQSVYPRTGLNAGWGIKTPGEKETATFTTLDDYCNVNKIDQIDFLKCDVEGHEHDVFLGAAAMLKRQAIKRIQFEYGGCNIDARVLLKDMFEMFSGLNYTFYKIMPKRLIKIGEYDQRLENFTHKNFAILHSSVID